jgi:hypothetical protein
MTNMTLELQYDIKLRSQFQNTQLQVNNTKPHDNYNNNNDSSFYPEVNSLPQPQQQEQPQTPLPGIIPNIIFFSYSLTGLMKRRLWTHRIN